MESCPDAVLVAWPCRAGCVSWVREVEAGPRTNPIPEACNLFEARKGLERILGGRKLLQLDHGLQALLITFNIEEQ